MNNAYVLKVDKNSIASEVGITSGDLILSINRKKIIDIFDYKYLIIDEYLLMEVQKEDGEIWEIEIEKDEDEELGINFTNDLIDCEKSCNNKCIFCFIDQLPKGMRETLYFKDDDSRLSFLTGNYATLTNMDQKALERIARLRLSPINVSVHTTNPALRIEMLKNKFAGDVLNQIGYLASQNIEMNTQIVLCKGLNDGKELERTINDLRVFYPHIKSLSVVPVGVSKYREGLYPLSPFNKSDSQEVIDLLLTFQAKYQKEIGVSFVYIADEFYINAGMDMPDATVYDGFPQIENGVGLVTSLRDEIKENLEKITYDNIDREVTIATGTLAYPFIKEMCDKITHKYDKIKITVYGVTNQFFGSNVNVAGLLTGSDLISLLSDKKINGELLISRSMLKADQDIFLDDITLEQLQQKLNVNIKSVTNSGNDFVRKIVEGV